MLRARTVAVGKVGLLGQGPGTTHAVILDITGVRTIDTHVAEALLRLARAVRLLGAKTVVTGISPEVAQTLVDLGDLVTLGDLRDGIAHAASSGGGRTR